MAACARQSAPGRCHLAPQERPMPASPFDVLVNRPGPGNPATQMVVERATGRFLGAFGTSFYRSWVFPLYTPSGLTVLQEFAYDHPFHNGLFVAQHPVHAGG